MPLTKINGVNLFWEMTGDSGPPIVMVHGSWVDHHTWDAVVPQLSKSFRVVTYDRRGHSMSERISGQGSITEDVADLAALLEYLQLIPANIVGNSFGSVVILKMAAQSDEYFNKMIIHEPPMFPLLHAEPSAQKALQNVGERTHAVISLLEQGKNEEAAEMFVEKIAFGTGAWEKLPTALQSTFIYNAQTWLDESHDDHSLTMDLKLLKKFRKPAFISQGELSPALFPLVIDKISAVIPHAERKIYMGAGHVPHLSHPVDYVNTLTHFILRDN